jgi:hypothetical protein
MMYWKGGEGHILLLDNIYKNIYTILVSMHAFSTITLAMLALIPTSTASQAFAADEEWRHAWKLSNNKTKFTPKSFTFSCPEEQKEFQSTEERRLLQFFYGLCSNLSTKEFNLELSSNSEVFDKNLNWKGTILEISITNKLTY